MFGPLDRMDRRTSEVTQLSSDNTGQEQQKVLSLVSGIGKGRDSIYGISNLNLESN